MKSCPIVFQLHRYDVAPVAGPVPGIVVAVQQIVLAIILVSTFCIRMGGRALETTGALVAGAALASAHLAFRGRLLPILRRFSI